MKDFKEILEKIAKENGTTPENVFGSGETNLQVSGVRDQI